MLPVINIPHRDCQRRLYMLGLIKKRLIYQHRYALIRYFSICFPVVNSYWQKEPRRATYPFVVFMPLIQAGDVFLMGPPETLGSFPRGLRGPAVIYPPTLPCHSGDSWSLFRQTPIKEKTNRCSLPPPTHLWREENQDTCRSSVAENTCCIPGSSIRELLQ